MSAVYSSVLSQSKRVTDGRTDGENYYPKTALAQLLRAEKNGIFSLSIFLCIEILMALIFNGFNFISVYSFMLQLIRSFDSLVTWHSTPLKTM